MTQKIGLISVFVVLQLLSSCTSRYRLDLYVITEETKAKVKVEQTQYIPGTELSNPFGDPEIVSGNASTAIVHIGFRGEELPGLRHFGIGFDEYVRYRIYLQLPPVPEPAQIDLKDNSIVQMLGHFEVPQQSKIYRPVEGVISIDSLKSDKLFCTIKGRFENPEQNQIELDGQFKMKTSQ